MNTTDLNNITIEGFKKIPRRNWNEVLTGVSSITFLPIEEKHDSGYSMIEAICQFYDGDLIKIGGGTDSFDFCDELKLGLDILHKSKLARVFSQRNMLMDISADLSSIYVSKTKQ